MTNIGALYHELAGRGIQLWAEEDRLGLRAPKGALSPADRETLKANKDALLAFLKRTGRVTKPGEDTISAIPRDGGDLPPSFAQERLWFLFELEGPTSAYTLPLAMQMEGPLASDLLQTCLRDIVKWQESTRTWFRQKSGRPYQVVSPDMDLPLHVIDLQPIEASQRETVAAAIMGRESRHAFDLSQPPLIRANLIRLTPSSHTLLITIHHIIADGWSLGVFNNALAQGYRALLERGHTDFPNLAVQYADYAAWQRKQLTGALLETQLNFWRMRLEDAPALLELPTDRPRPLHQSSRGGLYQFTWSNEFSNRVKQRARTAGGTLFATLLAGFSALLSRYTGLRDIVTGTPIANRAIKETEPLIGFFINTLLMRVNLGGKPGFQELQQQVHRMAFSAFAHQDLPFELLVEALKPERTTSYSPLFQVLFVLQNAPLTMPELPGLKITQATRDNAAAKMDLALSMEDKADGLAGDLEYNADLFDQATVARIAGHFYNLMGAALEQPETPVHNLPIMSDEEARQILFTWNDTGNEYPRERCVHEIFEAHAMAQPDAAALAFEDQTLTYAELNSRANSLAHYLRMKCGVAPDKPVGIYLERSLEYMTAVLAVLKAGGAFVPLDPEYPADRINVMLEEAAPRVLLSGRKFEDRLPAHAAALIRLDADSDQWEHLPQTNPENYTSPDNLVYTMFTSGSTGRPKGVAVVHRGIIRMTQQVHYAQFKPQDVFILFAPISFDASTQEMWCSLLNGARLVIPPPGPLDLLEIGRLLRCYRVSICWITAGLLHMMIDERLEDLVSVRQLLSGGDAISPAHIQRLRGRFPQNSFTNCYGPTENTAFTTTHRVNPEDSLDYTVPIGRPIPNTTVYVLDDQFQPVPVGVPGELYTGGDGLARGYLNHPELTAEKFLPNPFSEKQAARLYRTGDRVRFMPNAGGRAETLEFLGRVDQQVKIRGFRVEPGEITAVLKQHEHVKDALVVVDETRAEAKQLIAYIVAQDPVMCTEDSPLSDNLRDFLKDKMPNYMVPSFFVPLAAFPLNHNDKIDRKALPKPRAALRETDSDTVLTPTEELIGGIWKEMLGLEAVGRHDNFFELGGHSLLATRVISRLREAFRIELSVKTLFEAPTLEKLARATETARGDELPPLEVVERSGELPLSYAQKRLWFLNQFEGPSATYNIAVKLRLTGHTDIAELTSALKTVITRHEALRTTFVDHEGQPHQVIHQSPEDIGFEVQVLDLSLMQDRKQYKMVQELSFIEADRPFDLEHGPLIRAVIMRITDWEHMLLISIHHIVSDGWSIGVLTRELGALYQPLEKAGELPPLRFQYADFARWQRKWLSGQILEKQLQYWRSQLAGAPELLELPTDRPRPAQRTYRGATTLFPFNARLSTRLSALSRESGATMFMTLTAGFISLLSRYSGQKDISIGTPSANRNHRDIEPLVGFFVNTLVLRLDLTGNPSFRELLQQMEQVSLNAFSNQDVPFEVLVDDLNPDRNPSYAPFFQHMFVLQNTPLEPLKLPGLLLKPVDVESTTAKFDLTMSMEETENGLRGGVEYNIDLFNANTIERMVSHFRNFLEAGAATPELPITNLPLMTESETRNILFDWNATHTPYPRNKSVNVLFEETAALQPDATAYITGDLTVTYRELDRHANQLAHYLRRNGVVSETPVGVMLDRSPDLLPAILAVLKAGGAYVPLCPDYPEERISQMLDEVALPVIIHQTETQLPPNGARIIKLDREKVSWGKEPDTPPAARVDADHLAYIMFTSGSTGLPKGVEVTHRAILRLVRNTQFASFGPHEVFLQFSPVSFDASTLEIWGSLLNGARLVLPPPGPLGTEELGGIVRGHRVSFLWLTAGLFHLMVDERLEDLGSVRQLLAGGDVISPTHAARIRSRFPETRLINGYGPTENTTFTCCHPISDTDPDLGNLPIGRPIANTQAYVLDEFRRPVPLGVAGELYTGGDGLARGYYHRPDLTRERFVSHPFSNDPHARLYRTGDRVRLLADAEGKPDKLSFLGRVDRQVKIRGFRVEPSEIEHYLQKHPQVRESVVAVRQDWGEKFLAAYLIPKCGPGFEENAFKKSVRAFLQDRLPKHMLPSTFTVLSSLTLTHNGKVDREKLPAPERETTETTDSPAGETEKQLSAIWCELLGLEKVGTRDDFFQIGGDSLLATRLVSRMRIHLKADITLRQFFVTPTIRQLADRIEAAKANPEAGEQITRVQRTGPQPVSFSQQRLWFLSRLEGQDSVYNISTAFDVEGELDLALLEACFSDVIQRHEVLRTTFMAHDDGPPVQVIHEAQPFRLLLADLHGLGPEQCEREISRHISLDNTRGFDLDKGPLLRATLLRTATGGNVLLLTIHHIVFDGWSINVLIKELTTCYTVRSQGVENPLPELPLQYADFAVWQRASLKSGSLEKQREYWRAALSGYPQILELPTDYQRPPAQTYRGVSEWLRIPVWLSTDWRTATKAWGVTPYMSLFAIYICLLFRYTGQTRFLVGSPIANRNRVETEGLIGFFVNTFVLKADLSNNPSFIELLQTVKQNTTEAFAHQDFPFEELVDTLKPERSLSRSPLFQVMFDYQDTPNETVALSDQLRLVARPPHNEVAKFDITLSIGRNVDILEASFEYNTDLFKRATIKAMTRHFQTLMENVLEAPDQPINELTLLTTNERRQLMQWNQTDQDLDKPALIHHWIEQNAERRPDRIAVVYKDQRLTYAALNAKANYVAKNLRDMGVGPEVPVGLNMERSLEMVIGTLAILKAGGGYVPLDSAYPDDRLQYIVRDSKLKLILCNRGGGDRFAKEAIQVYPLYFKPGSNVGLPETPKSGVIGQNLAYIIYTSGSTGRPKGSLLVHDNVLNFVPGANQRYCIDETDRLLQFSSINFDVAVEEIFCTLANGGQLVLNPDRHLSTIPTFFKAIQRWGITVLSFPTAYWNQLVTEVQEADLFLPPTIRLVIMGGERAKPELLAIWRKRVGEATHLVNSYGPTEATIVGTISPFLSVPLPWEGREVPIGGPTPNVRGYIVDRGLHLMPIGLPGELMLGGMGLARGYLGRPALTAERFIPNPFASQDHPGERLYRTGDVVRYLPESDGMMEYVRRVDDQVKLQGFRIEPGEIETVLASHPEVNQAVVLVREDQPGNPRLVGYFLHHGSPPETTTLKDYLKSRLPDYMVPVILLPLDIFPMSPNGKVNRAALPVPEDHGKAGEPPRNPSERALAVIWQQVLNITELSIDSNFFEMGGSSIKAVALLRRLDEAFPHTYKISDIFDYPTIEKQAEQLQIRQQKKAGGSTALSASKSKGRRVTF